MSDIDEIRDELLDWEADGWGRPVEDEDPQVLRFGHHVRALLREIERLWAESEDHRLAMVESDRQRDRARAEAERLGDGIRFEIRALHRAGMHDWAARVEALLNDRENHDG